MKTIVIYHAGCWDGFCAAWLLHQAYPDAEFRAAHYGTPLPDTVGKRVIIADFSYKRPVMERIIANATSVTVLDHHKTAKAELDGLPCDVIFDLTKSGARLTWEWLKGAQWAPNWLVSYTEDRDLWKWELPKSREINTALRRYPLEFSEWDRLEKIDPFTLVPEGQAIMCREQQIVDQHIRHAREKTIGGHLVPVVNATVLFSEIAGELAKGKPFAACYFDRFDGKRVYSLRSDSDGLDVSEIAKLYGGGGHKNAAGFEVSSDIGMDAPEGSTVMNT